MLPNNDSNNVKACCGEAVSKRMDNTYKYMMDTLNRLDSSVMALNVAVAELRVVIGDSRKDVDGIFDRIRKIELDLNYRKGIYVVICTVGATIGGMAVWIVQNFVVRQM